MKKVLLIIGIIAIIFIGYIFIEAKYIKGIDDDGKRYIVKEGDSIYKDGTEIKIIDIQSEKVIINEQNGQREMEYNKEYSFYLNSELEGGGWISSFAPGLYMTFEKSIF